VLLQLKGVIATLVWSFVMSLIILKVIDLIIGIRVSSDDEREGLDISQHGESIE
jgi:Amt family ammonium transporter